MYYLETFFRFSISNNVRVTSPYALKALMYVYAYIFISVKLFCTQFNLFHNMTPLVLGFANVCKSDNMAVSTPKRARDRSW